MNYTRKNNPELYNLITGDIMSNIEIARSAAFYMQKYEPLTVKGFAKSYTVTSSLTNSMRMMIFLKDLFDDTTNLSKMRYCGIDNFFSSIVNSLNTLFSGGSEINFKYISKLESSRTFYINTIGIEKILYALIYCLVKNFEETDKKEIKIIFDESINKNKNYILTVTSGGKHIAKRLSDIFTKDGESCFDIFDIDTLSLMTAYQNAGLIGGSICYKSTKTLNKFIFSFPHINEFDSLAVKEAEEYKPDTDLMSICFHDLLNSASPEVTPA